MDKQWIQDIMSQKFTNGTFVNPTRLIMLTAFLRGETISNRYLRSEVLEFVYRTYIDNLEIARRNSNLMVRNIGKYGLSDISGVLDEALYDWKSDAVNSVLGYDSKWIYLDIDPENLNLVTASTSVLKMLYSKYFKISILEPKELMEDDISNDMDLNMFGKGLFRNRVLEDMQYCPLCEETNLDNLFAVHIIPNNLCDSIEERKDKANGILLCREHAEAYISKQFVFSAMGFVEDVKTDKVNTKMHLSFAVKTQKRKKMLDKCNKLRRSKMAIE
ncbi:MAG: hypothetical protein PHX08_07535 [Lachnospiraceae bacterium]|nr:hypothetical protein [Lachnospiraceae bacterium]